MCDLWRGVIFALSILLTDSRAVRPRAEARQRVRTTPRRRALRRPRSQPQRSSPRRWRRPRCHRRVARSAATPRRRDRPTPRFRPSRRRPGPSRSIWISRAESPVQEYEVCEGGVSWWGEIQENVVCDGGTPRPCCRMLEQGGSWKFGSRGFAQPISHHVRAGAIRRDPDGDRRAEGIEPLLKVFSFLHRKTDFRRVPEGHQERADGFAPARPRRCREELARSDQAVRPDGRRPAPAPAAAGAKASAPAVASPRRAKAKGRRGPAARRGGRARARARAAAAAEERVAPAASLVRRSCGTTRRASRSRSATAASARLLVDADAVRRDRVRRPAREGRLEGRGRRAHERPAQGRLRRAPARRPAPAAAAAHRRRRADRARERGRVDVPSSRGASS